MDNTKGEQSRPRGRILSAAAELFHRHGIRSVGVEAIAKAADTHKMTFYYHFASKDELIAQYLSHFTELAHSERPEPVDAAEALLLLRTWLSEMADDLNDPDGRGCRFANAAVELPDKSHPARRVIKTYKIAHRRWLIRLCRAAELSKPAMLADTLYLLLEGARVTTQTFGRAGIGARFRRLGEVTIGAHISK